ncbi:hypothetical protein DVK02_14950 [Halobellus sp. Atlit-31R]|nr:hypothetical protein DVK02_14950 [Halobellus sp. Atlit-31R]
MKSTLFGLAAVLLLLVVAAPAVNVAYNTAGSPAPVVNESVTVAYDDRVAVAADGTRYSESITVRADGDRLDRGTDYRWTATNGTIELLNTSATTSGQSAQVTYDVYERGAATEAFATIFNFVGRAGFLVLLLIGAGLALDSVGRSF